MSDLHFYQSSPYMGLIITASRYHLKNFLGIDNNFIAQYLAEYCIYTGLEINKMKLIIGYTNLLETVEYQFLGYHQVDNNPRNAKPVFAIWDKEEKCATALKK